MRNVPIVNTIFHDSFETAVQYYKLLNIIFNLNIWKDGFIRLQRGRGTIKEYLGKTTWSKVSDLARIHEQ